MHKPYLLLYILAFYLPMLVPLMSGNNDVFGNPLVGDVMLVPIISVIMLLVITVVLVLTIVTSKVLILYAIVKMATTNLCSDQSHTCCNSTRFFP